MSSTAEAAMTATISGPSQLRAWEHAVTWLIFALGAFGLFGFPYAAGVTWQAVWELVRVGALPIIGFVPPVIFFLGAALLVLRRKWATFFIAIHIPLAIAYLSSRYGIGSISALWWIGYTCEALMVCFCIRLWARGVLR